MVDFKAIGATIGQLVTDRNKTYGDSFARAGNVLAELYPNGVQVEDYKQMLAVVRVIDKLFRIANGQLEDSWRDVAGYGILGQASVEEASVQAEGPPEDRSVQCTMCGGIPYLPLWADIATDQNSSRKPFCDSGCLSDYDDPHSRR